MKRRCKHCLPLNEAFLFSHQLKILASVCARARACWAYSANASFYRSYGNKITTRVLLYGKRWGVVFFSSLQRSYNTVFIEHPRGSMPLKYPHVSLNERYERRLTAERATQTQNLPERCCLKPNKLWYVLHSPLSICLQEAGVTRRDSFTASWPKLHGGTVKKCKYRDKAIGFCSCCFRLFGLFCVGTGSCPSDVTAYPPVPFYCYSSKPLGVTSVHCSACSGQ